MSSISHLLTQTCEIQRAVVQSVSFKQIKSPAYETIANRVRCFVTPLSSREQASIIGRLVSATHKLFTETEIKAEDRIVWKEQTFIAIEVKWYENHHYEILIEALK